MSLTINATLKDPHANSYVDVAYCDGYWAQHFSADKAALWSALTSPKKESALIQACRMIEILRFTQTVSASRSWEHTAYLTRTGHQWPTSARTKLDSTQALQFPRNVDLDATTGAPFVPEAVKMAQCEQAAYLLSFDESVLAATLQGITQDSLHIGSLRTLQRYERNGTALAPIAKEFLRPLVIRGSVRFERA